MSAAKVYQNPVKDDDNQIPTNDKNANKPKQQIKIIISLNYRFEILEMN
jgi:hypothetical protein